MCVCGLAFNMEALTVPLIHLWRGVTGRMGHGRRLISVAVQASRFPECLSPFGFLKGQSHSAAGEADARAGVNQAQDGCATSKARSLIS